MLTIANVNQDIETILNRTKVTVPRTPLGPIVATPVILVISGCRAALTISYNSLHNISILFVLFSIATDAVDLECESSIGNVFVRVMECEAEFELVDIQCSINRTTLGNCKSTNFKKL